MLIVALILFFALDTMVHNMLYDYVLVFSHTWAEPYWLMMRTSMTLIAIVTLSILKFVYPLLGKKPVVWSSESVLQVSTWFLCAIVVGLLFGGKYVLLVVRGCVRFWSVWFQFLDIFFSF